MKILNIANRIPFPLKDGGAIALYRQVKFMRQAGAEIHLISVISDREPFSEAEIRLNLKNMCRFDGVRLSLKPTPMGAFMALLKRKSYNISRFENQELFHLIKKTLEKEQYDLVQFESIFMAPYLKLVKQFGIPTVLRQHNAEFQIWERRAQTEKNPLKRIYLQLLARQLKEYETSMLKEFDAVVSITEEDQHTFEALGCDQARFVYEAGIEIPKDLPPIDADKRHKLYHIGSMEWIPNREGLTWFIEHCWPRIHALNEGTELHIAGKGLENPFIASEIPYQNHEEVASAETFIRDMGVCIVPIRSGSGIRIKILEAILAGKVVISSSTGIQGLRLENGIHYLEANTPETFAVAVKQIQDKETFVRICTEARKRIMELYNAELLAQKLIGFYQKTVLPH